ncbi:uncharacterized protein At3g52155, chloroplastic [Mercurialis annua]|uniref:uncharacterized protein At3g52155, chloroplastic n=1 Tax=Mercurialis annua TaxID=3986 RepID=UPI002160909C|nr:uncharacterized protein At3g52155, chloroplastic [Mercurialis annua]
MEINSSILSSTPPLMMRPPPPPYGLRRKRNPIISTSFRLSLSVHHHHRCKSLATTTEILQQKDDEEEEAKSAGRRLILLRHAKSSWDNPSLRDHDRPLSQAGRADATTLSLKLQQLGWIPQLILSSDAKRTRETLQLMQQRVPAFLNAQVHFISSFYSIAAMDGQTAYHLQQAICKYCTDDIHTVMCMGHNRGWEEAASMFTDAFVELKTCNAALLQATGSSWEEAFALAGLGGWKLEGIVKPSNSM